MIYKLKKGGIVKLQSAWTTIPLFDNTATQMFEAAKNSGAQRGTQWYEQSKIVKEAEEKARKQVESEKPKYTYVNPYDYLRGWRESTEDVARQNKYTVENLGGSKEEAEAAYNATKENAAKQLAGTTATGLGTVALLGLSGGAAGPVVADIVNTGFGVHGLYNLASGNGIQKTIRLANQGDTWGAIKSGAGDLLDLSMGLHAAKLWGNLGKSMLAGQSLGNAYRGNVAGREMSNLVRSFNVSENPFYSNPTVVSTIDHLYKEHPELAEIGPKEAYSQYYKTIFPASKVQIPYAHGTRGDLSKGLEGSTKVSYTAAPETIGRNDFYLNLQPEASLQYADGVGVPEGFTWNKHRFWPLKEILGKPYKSDSWMFEPIQLRKQIPNRAGQFSRVKNADGTYSGHGKLLEEYKAELGMQDLSDKEFLQRFGIKDGETFEQWVAENKQKFSDIYNSGNYQGLYHVKVDASNPLTINGGNTYYSERGIWDTMNAGKNDVLLHNNAANEFGSDVMVVKDVDPSKVRILGSDPDKQAFIDFMNGHNIPFTSIPQKPVSTVHFDPRVKPMSRPISEAERLGIPKGERSNPQNRIINSNKFASEVRLGDGDYSDTFIDDATTIAQSIMNPGKMSNEAIAGIERMKSAFQSDWMKTRLRNIGYTEDEINAYINNRLAGLDLSKTSVAENLSAIRPLEARTSGSITIKPGVEVGYGQNYNGLGIEPFDQQFIQITRDGNVKDIISHEVGGHGTENFDFFHDKFGNRLYSKTKLTNLGKSVAKDTGLGESYYLDPKEQRARFIVAAQDMFEQGLNPNSYPDFVKFIVKNQNAPISTNTGQTAKFYDFRTLWPAFSKAHSILPITVGIGLGGSALSKHKQGGILKAQGGWKALDKINVKAIPDSTFTPEKTGAGSIEYFAAEQPEGITYPNGYHKDHPSVGEDVILYNPKTNDEQDIKLDALHIMPKDATYDILNTLYRRAAAKDGDVAFAAKKKYEEDLAKYGKDALGAAGMTPKQYFENEADGFLRNMLIEGTPEYIKSKNYYPDKKQLAEWNKHLMPYVSEIKKYLETGERPWYVLPESKIVADK